jgi:hypothetical protein
MGGFFDCAGKQFRFHKMGTGASDKEAAVFYKPTAPQIDFAVAFHCIFHRIS